MAARRTPSPTIRPRNPVADEDDLPPEFGAEEQETSTLRTPRYPSQPLPAYNNDPDAGTAIDGSQIDPTVEALPIFAAAMARNKVVRIRVESLGIDATYSHEGELPANATMHTLIAQWKRPGTFRLTPLDVLNNPVGESKTITVSPTNIILIDVLRQSAPFGSLNSQGAGAVPAMPTSSGNDPQMYAFLQMVLEKNSSEREAIMLTAQAERAAAEAARQEANEKLAAASVMLAERTSAQTDNLMARHAELAARNQEQTMNASMSLFQVMTAQQEAALERERVRAQNNEREAQLRMAEERERRAAELERMKAEAEIMRMQQQAAIEEAKLRTQQRIEEERQAAQERLAQMRLDMEERDRARQEAIREAQREREMREERQREQDREFREQLERVRREEREDAAKRREALDALAAAKDPIGSVIGMATTVLGGLKKLGVDPQEMLTGFMAAKSSGWADVVKEVVGFGKEVVKASAGVLGEESEEGEDGEEVVTIALPDGTTRNITRAQYAQLLAHQQAMQAQQQARQGPAAGAPAQIPQQMQQQAWTQPGVDPMLALANGVSTQHHVGAQSYNPPLQQQPPQQFAPPPVPQQAPPAQGTVDVEKSCVRLVEAFENTPPEAWQNAVTQWVMQVGYAPAMTYLQHYTIRGALRRAGANEELVEQVVTMLNASGMVPAEIPRG